MDIAVHGDVLPTIAALMPLLNAKKSRRFRDRMLRKHDRLMNKAVGAYTRNVEKKEPIHPEYAASLLDQTAAKDAIFTADTGMCNVWTARYINPLGTRRLIGSYLHGSMANALGMVKLEMLVDGLPDFGVDVPDANYAEVARALGFHAVRVSDPSKIEQAYREAFAHQGPSLVELITDPKALSIPPKTKGSQILGSQPPCPKLSSTGAPARQ